MSRTAGELNQALAEGVCCIGRAMVRLSVLPLLLLIGACSTMSSLPGLGSASSGGGYYLDDGPGGQPPVDPMSVPDAVPRPEPLNARNSRPYVALGKRYEPMSELTPYRARGVASWYGRRYHGRKTASGEPYDMYAMTGAHPTLPLPCYVRVTHLENRRSVIVRINDRGPFLQERLIDLSYSAAARLGFLSVGTAPVEVELITRFDEPGSQVVAENKPPAPAAAPSAGPDAAEPPVSQSVVEPDRLNLSMQAEPTPAVPSPPAPTALTATPAMPSPPRPAALSATPAAAGNIYLQLGAYSSQAAAQSAAERIRRELGALLRELQVRQEGGLFKLHAGPYAGRDEALGAAQRIAQASALKPFAVTR
ncbi:MAG: septal ring lytic transglycosylase RlpA family protein [Quisquiliibacterium sp.]